jgi:hypothetical protein
MISEASLSYLFEGSAAHGVHSCLGPLGGLHNSTSCMCLSTQALPSPKPAGPKQQSLSTPQELSAFERSSPAGASGFAHHSPVFGTNLSDLLDLHPLPHPSGHPPCPGPGTFCASSCSLASSPDVLTTCTASSNFRGALAHSAFPLSSPGPTLSTPVSDTMPPPSSPLPYPWSSGAATEASGNFPDYFMSSGPPESPRSLPQPPPFAPPLYSSPQDLHLKTPLWPPSMSHLPALPARLDVPRSGFDGRPLSKSGLARHRFSDSAIMDSRCWAPLSARMSEASAIPVSVDMRRYELASRKRGLQVQFPLTNYCHTPFTSE